MITFTIEGKPRGKDRPRFGNGRVYTTSQTLAYEELIRLRYKESAKGFTFPVTIPRSGFLVGLIAPININCLCVLDTFLGML